MSSALRRTHLIRIKAEIAPIKVGNCGNAASSVKYRTKVQQKSFKAEQRNKVKRSRTKVFPRKTQSRLSADKKLIDGKIRLNRSVNLPDDLC